MPPASNEEQFKFLISCIRYSNSGKVDFEKVANECHIVSKGAAAKRYERMMKTHGIAPTNTNSPTKNVSTPKASPQKEDFGLASKKRKVDTFYDEDEDDFEEDNVANVKMESEVTMLTQPIKREPTEPSQTEISQAKIFQTEPVKGKASARRRLAFSEMSPSDIFQTEPVKRKAGARQRSEMGQAEMFKTEPVKGKAVARHGPGFTGLSQAEIFQTEPVKGKTGAKHRPAITYETPPFGDLPLGSDYTRGNFVGISQGYVFDKPLQISAVQAAGLDNTNEESSRDKSVTG